MTPDAFETLMVKAVDGLASPGERETLMSWLADHPELATEYETHLALKALTDGWVKRLEADLIEDRFEKNPLSRVEKGVGWTLFLIGYALLMGGGVGALWVDPEVPTWVKWGAGLVTSGTLVLLISAIRWKWNTMKSDPYKEVIR